MKTTLHEQIHEALSSHGPMENRDQLVKDLMALIPQVDGGRALVYPQEMTMQLSTALGLQDYQITPMVELFRAAGHVVPAGDEQAFVLHRMVLLVLEHGIQWQAAWSDLVLEHGIQWQAAWSDLVQPIANTRN